MSAVTTNFVALLLAAVNAALSTLALPLADDPELVRGLALVSFVIFALLCLFQRDNLLFLARTFILGFIGYFAMIVKALFGPDAMFSAFEPATQGLDIAVIMYVTTSYALLSSEIGFRLAMRDRLLPGTVQSSAQSNGQGNGQPGGTRASPGLYWWLAGMIGIALALFAAFMFVRGYGKSVLVAEYGSADRGGKGMPFGSVGILGAVGLFSLYVAGARGYIRHWKWLFGAVLLIYVVYSQLLMGVRQDAMSLMFGLCVIYGVVQRRELGLKLSYIPAIVIFYVFFEIWGVARTALAAGISLDSIVSIASRTFTSINASDAVQLGTISPIATTFANTVYLVQHHAIDLAFGRSYGEWLLRIPPEALYPNRPKDYAWLFEEYGLMAAGGFFELAEVYMNFGILGGLLIPGVISYLLGKSYYFALRRQTVLSYFTLFAFLSIFLRGTWYQTFAFFRALLVCLCLYFAYLLLAQWLRAAAGSAPSREVYG